MCVLGASGVGKSSLVQRFVEDRFEPEHNSSIAMSIFSGTVELGDVTLEMMLWDPAGVDAGGQYNRSFISGASGLIFVVDATKPQTLDHLLEAHSKERGFIGSRPAILVVNKSDRTGDFALSRAQIDAASKLEWQLVQASAKTGDSVSQVFTKLAEMMLEARKATG
ncbi:MAG: GTP-binding protein [Deltaproteobacteria bacterium]|nr:GTP-binding protein [Deltaproteobacteria bacterium]